MEDLTFGEQVKIVLGRKGMTIKELAEKIERETGKKMSRQNLTQRLGRDNFQEQDMRLIASILECPFQLSIMSGDLAEITPVRVRKPEVKAKVQEQPVEPKKEEAPVVEKKAETVDPSVERDMTIGELYDIHEELSELEKNAKAGEPVEEIKEELQQAEEEYKEEDAPVEVEAVQTESAPEETEEVPAEEAGTEDAEYNYSSSTESEEYTETYAQQTAGNRYGDAYEQPETEVSYTGDYVEEEPAEYAQYEEPEEEPVEEPVEEPEEEVGDINPYTGREYESNSVRMHPSRIGYVQVYDRSIHKWTDMTEWAFLGYQERKKVLLGKAYEPPIYLD